MADTGHIEDQLRGFWPTSQKITAQLIAEIGNAFKHLRDDDFNDALDKHRQGEDGGKVPSAKMLLKYIGKKRYSDQHLADRWINAVIQFGWEDAVERAYSYNLGLGFEVNNELRMYLINTGINQQTEKYFGFPGWMHNFIDSIHAGMIPEAYENASRTAPEKMKGWLMDKAKFYDRMGSEQAKKYFLFHRQYKKPEEVEVPF